MAEYDIHVATEGYGKRTDEFQSLLKERGFWDDKLASRQVTYLHDRPASSCPLIGLHMTKKFDTPKGIKEDMAYLREAIPEHGEVGYAHAEVTSRDTMYRGEQECRVVRPWPLKRFDSRPRIENKVWDMHLDIPLDNLPTELADILSYDNAGFYFIDLVKEKDGKERTHRIFTMQGVNPALEGRRVYRAIDEWLDDCNIPEADFKLETYIDMFRVGDPLIVPPTIDKFDWNNV